MLLRSFDVSAIVGTVPTGRPKLDFLAVLNATKDKTVVQMMT